LYNWGLALIQEIGLEQDRIQILILVYGQTVPNRLNLKEFESVVLKHTDYRCLAKSDRRYKWVDLQASFRIQSVKLNPGDGCWTIGKRELKVIFEVNDLKIDMDVVAFSTDLRRKDRYANKMHMLLLNDPLIQVSRTGKGLPKLNRSAEDAARAEGKSIEKFKQKLAEQEEEDFASVGAGTNVNASGMDSAESDGTNTAKATDKGAAEEKMRMAFGRQSENRKLRAAELAIKIAKKAEMRAAVLKKEEERRQRVAAFLASSTAEKVALGSPSSVALGSRSSVALGSRSSLASARTLPDNDVVIEVNKITNDKGSGNDDEVDDGGDDNALAEQGGDIDTSGINRSRAGQDHGIISGINDYVGQITGESERGLEPKSEEDLLRERLAAHQSARAAARAEEKRQLRELVEKRLAARAQRKAVEMAVAASTVLEGTGNDATKANAT
jgi:hypothetical protein